MFDNTCFSDCKKDKSDYYDKKSMWVMHSSPHNIYNRNNSGDYRN